MVTNHDIEITSEWVRTWDGRPYVQWVARRGDLEGMAGSDTSAVRQLFRKERKARRRARRAERHARRYH